MYKGFIDDCILSVSMREYLKNVDLLPWMAVDIVIGSPVSINIKLNHLIRLSEEPEIRADEIANEECNRALHDIKRALEQLTAPGAFSVEICNFDYDKKSIIWDFNTICASFDQVKDYIRKDYSTYPPDPEECKWYYVKKWNITSEGKYDCACNYYMAGEEVLFVTCNYENSQIDLSLGGELKLPVPFKAGDILEVDGFPFGPKFRMLILSIGDNKDCCSLQGLAKNDEGLWSVGAVKHGLVSYSYYPKTGYLYTADYYNGELPSDERILNKIKEYIGNDPSKGEECWNSFLVKDMTDEEINELL